MRFSKNRLILFWSFWSLQSIIVFWTFFKINHVWFEFLKVCETIHYIKSYIVDSLILLVASYEIRIEVFNICLSVLFKKFTFNILLKNLNITFMDHGIFKFVFFSIFKFINVGWIELHACVIEFLFCNKISHIYEYFYIFLFTRFHRFKIKRNKLLVLKIIKYNYLMIIYH